MNDLDTNDFSQETLDLIKSKIKDTKIKNIVELKRGMTNKSFLFDYGKNKYIIRIPGENTNLLLNRKEEAEVYNVIKNTKICDEIYYINPDKGYKITKYIENARICDTNNWTDVKKCMKFLKDFHNLKLKVNHEFNLFEKIDFYESLWNNKSIYKDYKETKENVKSLSKYIEKQKREKVLTHIDAISDNFLYYKENNQEKIKLIDWEYAGMQDPHVDIAMFCIYALYDKEKIDKTINLYFDNNCSKETRIKIYCYISICGLLWSNWCELKRNSGIDLGEYQLRQYLYAKNYYKIVRNEIEKW